jgi:RimJ/RimL family protein N-acetyltransferase
LRAFEPGDVAALHAYLNAPVLAGCRYTPEGFANLAPLSVHQVEGILDHWQKEGESWTLAVVDVESGKLMGHVHADWEWDPHCPSVYVVVAAPHQRQGIGSLALGLAVDFLFRETPAHAVSGWAASWNEPALAFMTCMGFTEAGRRSCAGVRGSTFYSDVAFDLLRSEWISAKGGHRAD